MQDGQLLKRYVEDGSEAAFGQIVARHLPLVRATCLRELGSAPLAEDAAQVVFLLLSGKAQSLRAGPSLAGWLFQAARFVSKDARRREARRQRREQAVMQEVLARQEASAPPWERVEPLLNDALAALKPGEREAVLVRFLEGHSLAETGAALGISEDAARMRVSRAVEKMRRHLTARGAAVTGVILAGLLTAEAARPVSAHAAVTITPGAPHAAPGRIAQLLKGVQQTMWMTRVKAATFAAAAVLLAGAAVPPLARALSPHPAGVRAQAQASPAPRPLKESITAQFTLDKDQQSLYSIALPEGSAVVVLDARRADGTWGGGTSGGVTSQLSYADKDDPSDPIKARSVHSYFQEVQTRTVDRLSLKKPGTLILNIHHEGVRSHYWLTVLPAMPAASSERSPALAVPLFGTIVPKPMTLGQEQTGRLAKNGYAYFALSLRPGHYRASLDFRSMSTQAANLNGDLFLNDENGLTAGGAGMMDGMKDIAQLHLDLGTAPPYREVRAFTLKT